MSALDSIKVTRAPGALADTARAVNALVDLVSGITGGSGIKVTVSEGRILIEASQAAPDLTKGTGGSGGGGGTATAVSANGTLLTDVSGTAGSSYPTKLKVVNGNDSLTLDSVGLTISKNSGALNAFFAFASFAHNFGIKTMQVCNPSTGNVQTVDYWGSDPY